MTAEKPTASFWLELQYPDAAASPWGLTAAVVSRSQQFNSIAANHSIFNNLYERLCFPWRRHEMEALSTLLALCEGNPPLTGGFPSQRVSNVGLWCIFVAILNKLLNKVLRSWWFETPWHSGDITVMDVITYLIYELSLQWRRNEWDGASNHQPHDCLLNRLQIKENIKAERLWPLWGELTGHQWIPCTNGQWRGKCFHLMMS